MHHSFSLQTLNSIAAEKNSTIIFPVPIDFVTQFANSKSNRQQQKASAQDQHTVRSKLSSPRQEEKKEFKED